MKEIDYRQPYKKSIVLSLGFFDCVHRGHRRLICEATSYANKCGIESFVFTFENNPFSYFNDGSKELLTYEERKESLAALGVDGVLKAKMSDEFARLSPEEFLDGLFSVYDVKAVFCGCDYTFGYKGAGDVSMLAKTAAERGVLVKVISYLFDGGNKISSGSIRNLVEKGDMERAKELIGEPYQMSGVVEHNAGRGAKYGIPTANVCLSSDKQRPLDGVYATAALVDGKLYNALTSVGAKPTFNDYSYTVETYIEDFSSNIYGKKVKVYFYKYLRPIMKFADKSALAEQIARDLAAAKEIDRCL